MCSRQVPLQLASGHIPDVKGAISWSSCQETSIRTVNIIALVKNNKRITLRIKFNVYLLSDQSANRRYRGVTSLSHPQTSGATQHYTTSHLSKEIMFTIIEIEQDQLAYTLNPGLSHNWNSPSQYQPLRSIHKWLQIHITELPPDEFSCPSHNQLRFSSNTGRICLWYNFRSSTQRQKISPYNLFICACFLSSPLRQLWFINTLSCVVFFSSSVFLSIYSRGHNKVLAGIKLPMDPF